MARNLSVACLALSLSAAAACGGASLPRVEGDIAFINANVISMDVERELERRVREATRRDRGDFLGVHVCPASAADVPDEPAVRLVVLAPGATHADRAAASTALEAARDALSGRG